MWIDSHCHLTSDSFKDDLSTVLQNAEKAGIKYFIVIGAGYGLDGNEPAVRLAEGSPKFYATVGIHPHDASLVDSEGEYLKKLKAWAAHPKVVALGEMGLDYHYDHSPKEVQQKIFREQLQLASKVDLPIVIHTREAWEDTLSIIREVGVPKRGGVFHCFGGNPAQAKEVIELGFSISITGIVTFKKSKELVETVLRIGLEHMLVETDAPYLAPVPFRGKRNEPAFVVLVGEKIAEIKKMPIGKVAKMTTENTKKLFQIL